MKIRSFTNKALKRLYQQDDARGLPAGTVDKIRKMLAFMDDMKDVEELKALTTWDAHALKGDRKGTWSLTVTRNWRLTFKICRDGKEMLTWILRTTTEGEKYGHAKPAASRRLHQDRDY